jgi:predicted metalloprotease
MALWDKISSRGNVEDRRSMSPAALGGGGLGIGGILLILAINYFTGGSATDVLNQLQNMQAQTGQQFNTSSFQGADNYEVFASTVLGSTNDTWTTLFAQSNTQYVPPKLVLFRTATQSACGTATSDVGPHYCPLNKTIYIDETFFDVLRTKFKAQGGDVAEAYVIAHEVGHHVQNITGELSKQSQDSIQTELQADCYAGIWAYSIKESGVFEPGEINEALDAAAAVGDDRIQATVEGRVNPETWTHGSSQQRTEAFMKGYNSGSVAECNLR